MEDAELQPFLAWTEQTLGGRVVRAARQGERRSGGRPAWFLDVETADGAVACYARMDRGEGQLVSREFTLEREFRILRALGDAGIRVPRVHGLCPAPAGILMDCVAGEFDYSALAPGAERDALDRDFLGELVRLHDLPVEPFAAQGLAVPKSAAEYALADLACWERTYRAALRTPVPLVTFATGWLHRNVPEAPERPSLIQGDTGPGQFLFEGSRVTAIIDWEFAHIADPMLDLAQVRTRDFYNPGADMTEWCRSYQELSGRSVELEKLRYYTVKSMLITPLALAGVVQNMVAGTDHAEWYAQDVCYKRASAEALAEAVGIDLEAPELPSEEAGPACAVLDLVEEDLAHEHRPTLPDGYARYRLDLTRRLLAHVRNQDRWGAELAEQETDADAALDTFIREAGPDRDAELIGYLYRRARREEWLWRGALGVGETAVFQPLR